MSNSKIEKIHGTVIKLLFPSFEYIDKQGSLFIFDEQIGMWCLKEEYEKLNKETDDFSKLPTLHHNQLDAFGTWRQQ